MASEGWRTLVENDWAGCVILHNLPFSHNAVLIQPDVLKKTVRSVLSIQGTASDWNYFDFKEQASQRR
jgi:hypothetical protein